MKRTRTPIAWMGLALWALSVPVGWPGIARADECASYGPRAWMSNPYNGSKVAKNARFQVDIAPSCGGVEGGPPHEFRLVNGAGAEIAMTSKVVSIEKNCQPVPCQTLELSPVAPLAPGTVVVEVRIPEGPGKLGPWEALARFEAAGWVDQLAPQFDGIAKADVSVVVGSAPISPCQAVPAWEIVARFLFTPARDEQTSKDDLLYALDKRVPGQSDWEELNEFRPNFDEATGQGYFDLRNQSFWGQSYEFRLRVADAAGHGTIGSKTALLSFPAKPSEEPSGMPENRSDGAEDIPAGGEGKIEKINGVNDQIGPRGGCAGCAMAQGQGGASVLGAVLVYGLYFLRLLGKRRAIGQRV